MMPTAKPAFRYFGSKFRLAPWIISHFPDHHEHYIEPFGGSASVLLRKAPSRLETYNDLNGDAVNFFQVLREDPLALITAIDMTPYSREEFTQAQQQQVTDPLERARRFYVWAAQGRGRPGIPEPGGWAAQSNADHYPTYISSWNDTDHLYTIARRLKLVQLENAHYQAVIQRCDHPKALFYLDPPYLSETRGQRWAKSGYLHEMSEADHVKLLAQCRQLTGMVIISGHNSELYNTALPDWRRVIRQYYDRQETLWLNPASQHQKTLF